MRIRDPKTTALIFASGKMVVTGAKSEDDSKLASRKYARIIQKLGFNAKFTDFKIQNIVGSCDIKFPIRLEGLASRHHNFSSYEPELFPGLIYRMIRPKIVLLIFVSGKIVLTGAKVRQEIYDAFEMIYPVLQGRTTPMLFYVLMANTIRFPQDLKHLDEVLWARVACLAAMYHQKLFDSCCTSTRSLFDGVTIFLSIRLFCTVTRAGCFLHMAGGCNGDRIPFAVSLRAFSRSLSRADWVDTPNC